VARVIDDGADGVADAVVVLGEDGKPVTTRIR
jgi:hypothetical protein